VSLPQADSQQTTGVAVKREFRFGKLGTMTGNIDFRRKKHV
jgi:hypothetical protein